jgi:tol-pal system protein YbgF
MTRLFTRGLTAAALAAGLFVSVAAAQESNSPLSAIGRMFGQKGQQGSAPDDNEGGPTTDQVLRIERLEAQIRQMTGQMEQLQYRNQQLENQVRSMGAAPVGANLVGGIPAGPVAGGPGAPSGVGPTASAGLPPVQSPSAMRPPMQAAPMPAAPLPPPGAIGRRSDVFDPSQNPSAPGAPRPLGGPQSEPPPLVTADTPVGAPGGRRAGAPLDLSTMSGEPGAPPSSGPLPPPPSRNLSATGAVASVAPPAETPKDNYDLAYGYLLRKDYAQAETTFQAFLKQYPNDRRAADAEFWLGESLFQRQRYDAAAQAFLDLSTKHKTHAKAPEALLRLAQSLGAMKQKEMSCATLAEIDRKYPKASAAVKQGVEREQKRVKC